MKRNLNEIKVVLDAEQMDTLSEALVFAAEYARGGARVAAALGDADVAMELNAKAVAFTELRAYSADVVRVAVTVSSWTAAPEWNNYDSESA